MSIKVNEIGKIIRLNAAFDMSGNSDLKLVFTKADGTILTVDKAGGVSAPAVAVETDIGIFEANEYWQYAIQAGDIDQIGQWKLHGEYEDLTPKLFCGDTTNFTVLPCT